MRYDQQANLLVMLAMFTALAAVVFMDTFHGVVTALILALFSLLLSVISRQFIAALARKIADKNIQLNNIINRSGVLIFVWRIEPGKWPVEYVSSNVATILGYTAGDFISGRVEWPAITHSEDVPRLEKEVAQYLEKGERKWSQEYRLITKSGEVHWFRADNLALEDSGGKISRVQAIVHDITERKQMEERLERVNRCLLSLGTDFNANAGRITALCGELLGGACALYNRLNSGLLCALGQWHTPPDFKPEDKPEGHICYDVIKGDEADFLFVPDLLNTRYAETDLNVRQYGLQSYLGQAVHCGNKSIGSLCVVFQHPFYPTENDKQLLGILASALGVEENRHADELTLLKSKQHFQTLLEASFDLIYVIDRDDTVRYVNSAALKALGRPGTEMVGKPRDSFFPLAIAAIQKLSLDQVFATGEPLFIEQKTELEGTIHWQDTQLAPLKNLSGTVDAVLGISRDITERKRTQDELAYKTMLLEVQAETSLDGLLVVDDKGHVIFHNKRFNELWKIPRQILDTKDDAKMLEYAMKQLKDPVKFGRKVAYLYEQRDEKSRDEIEFADGRCFDRYSSPLLGADGKHYGRIWYFRDITELKRAMKKAVMLADAIETAHHGCLIVAADFKVIFANNYALSKLGFTMDQLKNFDLLSLYTERQQVEDIIKTMDLTGRWMGETVIIRKDGSQFPALVSISALGWNAVMPGERGLITLFQDITIQKEMRDKLITSEKLAVMGRLVADVSHEINNPLAIIIGSTQLMLSRLDEKVETTWKNQLGTVLRNAQRCKTILSNLLGYGRTIGAGQEIINLPDLIREAILDVGYQHDMSGIEVVLNCNELSDATITGNRTALLSVFVNLVRNARQAMGAKGRLTIIIEKEDKKHLRIEIRDTGIGLSKEQKTKLFKPFTSGWKEMEGSGLGLTTSLGIIEIHGGHISAESEGEGQGATFAVVLPCGLTSGLRDTK